MDVKVSKETFTQLQGRLRLGDHVTDIIYFYLPTVFALTPL